MKRFGVAATQGNGADIFGIKRLPANRDLWLLRVILAVRRWLKWEGSRRKNCRGVFGVPLLPLVKVNFEAIETGEVPRRGGQGYPHFLVDRPNIPVHPCASPVQRAHALKRCVERVAIARPPPRVILTAESKGDRP